MQLQAGCCGANPISLEQIPRNSQNFASGHCRQVPKGPSSSESQIQPWGAPGQQSWGHQSLLPLGTLLPPQQRWGNSRAAQAEGQGHADPAAAQDH